jgi:1-aminocyclopropane-1-carboxylate deaminase/D-cysteine desulfhydrase-like pyridoxal-dependent ACC family enzyme
MNDFPSFEPFYGFPRVLLAQTPTPLIELKRLSALLKGPRIFMKREDLSGFAMGGNKVRKFEFFMADALQKGADCCIAIGAIQSNHARVAAAAALHSGLKAYLLLMGESPSELKGNLLLDTLLGAEIIYIPGISDFGGRLKAMVNLVDRLKEEGRKPYVLPVVSPLGCLGPCMAMVETLDQAESTEVDFGHQLVAVGSGETLLGLIFGATLKKSKVKTLGVCIGRRKELMIPTLEQLTSELLDLTGEAQQEVNLHYSLSDDFLGDPGHPTREGLEAIRLVARTEGVFLDPIYTGKAMATLIDLIQKKKFSAAENVLFWNTSSPSIFFAYDDAIGSGGKLACEQRIMGKAGKC